MTERAASAGRSRRSGVHDELDEHATRHGSAATGFEPGAGSGQKCPTHVLPLALLLVVSPQTVLNHVAPLKFDPLAVAPYR